MQIERVCQLVDCAITIVDPQMAINSKIDLTLKEILILVHPYLLAIGIRCNGFGIWRVAARITAKAALYAQCQQRERKQGTYHSSRTKDYARVENPSRVRNSPRAGLVPVPTMDDW